MKSISGAIIAGGKSTRMGVDKATIKLNQETFLQKAVTLISHFSDEIFISSNTNFSNIDIPIVKDFYKNIGPIAGLYSILKVIPTQKVLLIPVDTPLLTKDVIQYLLANYDKKKQISICKTDDGLQMLVGIFDKSILPLLKDQINKEDYKLSNLLEKASIQIINVEKFKDQFVNINTQADLKKLNNQNKK
ncbi:MAG TPA: molybdenum cofactor guanylyltransferase [Lutibacter sp.]|nr:molybdenum cofactor guanylyltransferase [Lutibacter sp.]